MAAADSGIVSPGGDANGGSSTGKLSNDVAGSSGAFNTSSGGSDKLTGACGASITRLPHRVRIMLLPSVITLSPCASRSCFFV